mgnify:CR=1 FL=1
MKYIYIIVLFFVSTYAGFAQQDAQYTQYMYNTVGINPAYAGNRGALSIVALHRSQWIGLEGAPTTQSISVNTPLGESNVGLGVSFINDKVGPSTEQYLNIDLSYTIKTSDVGKLSFGIKGVANFLNLDINKLSPETASDINLNGYSKFQPNFGIGAYYHTDKFYVGLSTPNVLETKHFDDGSSSVGKERNTYYLISGYVFDLSESVKLKPAFLVKQVKGSPLQVDLSANAMLNNKFILGAAYRWDAAVSFMAGFQINESLMLGYAYDIDTNGLGSYNNGSHEIMLRYELFNFKENLISPRFF